MGWVAFDRAWRAPEAANHKTQRDRLKNLADEIHADTYGKGVDPVRGGFVQAYGSQCLDGALLLLTIVGFLSTNDRPSSPRWLK